MFFSQPGLFFFSLIKPGAEKLRFWTGLFCCFSGLFFFFCVSALGRPTFFLIFFKKEFFHFAWFAFFPKYASTTVRVMLSKERFEPAPRAPNKFFELAKEHEVLPYPDPATHHFALLVASFFFTLHIRTCPFAFLSLSRWFYHLCAWRSSARPACLGKDGSQRKRPGICTCCHGWIGLSYGIARVPGIASVPAISSVSAQGASFSRRICDTTSLGR